MGMGNWQNERKPMRKRGKRKGRQGRNKRGICLERSIGRSF